MKSLTLKSTADDLDLAVLLCEPKGSAKGIFQVSHGMAEHKERYIPFMEYLASLGYVAVIHDHRGHGESVKSQEDLGFMYDGGWAAMVEDVKLVQDHVKSLYPGLPVTLFGHSMGSMVVRSFAKRYDSAISKLIVCGCPSDNPAKGAGAALASITGWLCGWHYRSSFLNNLAFGSYAKQFPQDGKLGWLSANRDNVLTYKKDPLCGFCFTANGFKNLLKLMTDCYDPKGWTLQNTTMPVRFISGADDPCRIDDKAIEKAAQMLRNLGYNDVTVKLLPGLRHEILLETDYKAVWEIVQGL